MANKFNSLKLFGYNWLNEIKYNSDYNQRLIQLLTRIGPRPIILNKNMVQVAVLENCFDVIIDQEVGGIDEIRFTLPMNDSKRELIVNEGYIQMFDDIYIIREINDKKKSKMTEVYAEAIWYDLQYAEPFPVTEWLEKTAYQMLFDVLKDTGWSVGTISFSNKRTLRIDTVDENRLGLLRKIENLFQGELWFDTQAKLVSLLEPIGFETGASVMYEKNVDEIEAHYDTRDLITKLFLYGANDMTISAANNGIDYLTNNTYSNAVRVQVIKDERYTNPYQLKEMGLKALNELSKPRASYVAKMGELAQRQGLEHERFSIGGIVRMYDKELNLNMSTRIMKWSYNVIEPWKTIIDLETKIKSLSDLLTGVDNAVETLASEQAIKGELMRMSVFNYLMNSRADDGFSYWTNTGWEIDPVNGSTSNASFKAIGDGTIKTLSQTVYPSSADDYAISFQAYSEGILVGEEGNVGIEIVITYEDNTTETKFVKLA